jgi:hypothetical protein
MSLILRAISNALEENGIRIGTFQYTAISHEYTVAAIDILADEPQDTEYTGALASMSIVHDSSMIAFVDYTESKPTSKLYSLPKTTYYQVEDPKLISKIVDAAKDIQNRHETGQYR